MSVAAVEQAIRLIEARPDAHFAGPRAELIGAAEAALGLTFPPSYRRFVETLGAGSIGSFEIYGVISEPFDGPIPDGVWATLHSRTAPSQLPASMLVIGDDGMGGAYVLDTAVGDEPPVRVWYGGSSQAGDALEHVASDFGTWFLEGVQEAIRT